MIRFLLPLLIFLIFISESIFVDVIPPEIFGIDRVFVPRFVMVVLIFIVTFLGRAQAIYYGLAFGLLFDIIYIDIIGIHFFLFPLITYIMSYLVRVLHVNLFVLFFMTIIGVALLELFVYGLYKLIGLNNMSWYLFMTNRLFPTLVLNGGFVILIFYPIRKLLVKMLNLQNVEN